MYVPNTIQTPIFNNKNELHLAGFWGLNGYNFQSSYLLSENIGFFGDYSFIKPKENEHKNFHEHNFLEAGVLYNYNSDKNINRDNLISIQTFVGFGHGSAKGDVKNVFKDTSIVFAKSDFNRYSIQMNLTHKGNKLSSLSLYRDGGVAFRFSVVDFYNLKSQIANADRHFTNIYMELGGFSHVGFENVQAEIQGFFCYDLLKKLDTRNIFFYLSLGFHVNFSL